MDNMRKKYQPIIQQLQDRIDLLSHEWATTRKQEALTAYTMLVGEICEIKNAIKENEKC